MSGSMNRVTLVGNLTRDPEIKTLNSGSRLANLRLATNESWKDKNGEKQEKVEYHTVVIWNDGLIGVVDKYLNKGAKILIEGKLSTRKWQSQNGEDRYSTEVVVSGFDGNLLMLGGGKREGDRDDREERRDYSERRGAPRGNGAKPPATTGPGYEQTPIDDDIPF